MSKKWFLGNILKFFSEPLDPAPYISNHFVHFKFLFILHINYNLPSYLLLSLPLLPPSLPFTNSSKRVRHTMGSQQTWTINLSQDEVPAPCIKTEQGISPRHKNGLQNVSSYTRYWSWSIVRSPSNRSSYATIARVEGRVLSHSGFPAVCLEFVSTYELDSPVYVDFPTMILASMFLYSHLLPFCLTTGAQTGAWIWISSSASTNYQMKSLRWQRIHQFDFRERQVQNSFYYLRNLSQTYGFLVIFPVPGFSLTL